MKRGFRTLLPYLIVLAAVYYGIPAAALGLENGGFLTAICLFAVFPSVSFFVYMAYAAKSGFSWLTPLACGALFIPVAIIFLNYTALPYAVAYIVLAYIGEAVGLVIRRGRRAS